MAALRYLQKQITQENYRNEIDRVVSKVYANKNSNVITPLSLLETDAMLAYLFEYVLKEKSTPQSLPSGEERKIGELSLAQLSS